MRRQVLLQPPDMGLHIFRAPANAGIDRELHPVIAVPQQKVAEAVGLPLVILCFDRQIEKDQQTHVSHLFRGHAPPLFPKLGKGR